MDEESWNTLVVVSVIRRNTYSRIEITLQEPILSILVYRMRLSSIITPNQSSPSPVTTAYLKPIHPCLLKYANHIPSKSTLSHKQFSLLIHTLSNTHINSHSSYHTTIRNKWDSYGLHHNNTSKRSVTPTPYTSRDFHHIQLITNQWNHTIDTSFITTIHSIHYYSSTFHLLNSPSLHRGHGWLW